VKVELTKTLTSRHSLPRSENMTLLEKLAAETFAHKSSEVEDG